MSTFRNVAVTLAALAVLVFFGVCAWIAVDVNNKVMVPFEAALKGKHANGDDGYLVLARLLMSNANGAANQAKQTLADANRIAKQQEGPTLALAQSSVKMLDAGTQTITKMNGSVDGLNGVIADVRTNTLPKLNTGMDSLNGTAQSLTAVVDGLKPVETAATAMIGEGANAVHSLNLSINHADALISDPSFKAIAGNLNSMSLNMNNASANINSATGHADKALGYVELDLTPTKLPFWRSILSEALSQAIGIPLKYFPTRVSVTSSVPVPVTIK